MIRTFEEVWLEIYIKDVAAKTFDRVVEGKDVHALSVFNIKALMYIYEIAELDLRLLRATLFICMRPSSTSSELRQIRTVSRLFLPLKIKRQFSHHW